MRINSRAKAGAVALALLLAVSACAGGNGSASGAEETGGNESTDGAEEPADAGGSAAGTAGERAEVAITDFAYEPETIEVPAGATVEWTNDDMFAHTVTDTQEQADGGRFDGELGDLDTVDAEGTTFEQTFDEPGTYEYFCRFHPDMRGTVVVTDG